jgi:hypothetical protein
VIVFGLLAVPWPGWRETYARYLRKSATAACGLFDSKHTIVFAQSPFGYKSIDTVICVANRERLAVGWSKQIAYEVFNSRMSAYFPTALVIALVLATGIGWRRRLCALVWGLLWIHVFIAILLGLMIAFTITINPQLGLYEISPFWQNIVSFLRQFFVVRNGARFATAVLIWIVVTFRRDDWINILAKQETVTGKEVQKPFWLLFAGESLGNRPVPMTSRRRGHL